MYTVCILHISDTVHCHILMKKKWKISMGDHESLNEGQTTQEKGKKGG